MIKRIIATSFLVRVLVFRLCDSTMYDLYGPVLYTSSFFDDIVVELWVQVFQNRVDPARNLFKSREIYEMPLLTYKLFY